MKRPTLFFLVILWLALLADYSVKAFNAYGRQGQDNCFQLFKTRTRIERKYIRRVLRTIDRAGCEAECARISACLGFNYRYRTDGANQYKDNCELSSERASGAGNYAFYNDDDFDFYERVSDRHNINCDNHDHWISGSEHHDNIGGSSGSNYYGGTPDFREECFRRAEQQVRPYDRSVRESFWADDIYDCMERCHRSRYFDCLSFGFGYLPNSGRSVPNCLLSDREYRDFYQGDFVPDLDFDFFERRLYDRECGIESREYESGRSTTVTGVPCKQGYCRLNKEGQFWACEIDISSWDYCCAPDEYCTYSQEFKKHWCKVGNEKDQMRPCNMEAHRAYLQHPRSRMMAGNQTEPETQDEEKGDNAKDEVSEKATVNEEGNNNSSAAENHPEKDPEVVLIDSLPGQ
ncbi:uncharacterized protein LOC143033029 [Oratosquilla oratoria]|uniref:uncharacterized protein LOC143033029 n=1 Tax=Oratosquilla oratoria TaxID=337810 RepID=UPI003F773A7C